MVNLMYVIWTLDAVGVIHLKMPQCYWRNSGCLIIRSMVWPMDFLWATGKMYGFKPNLCSMK